MHRTWMHEPAPTMIILAGFCLHFCGTVHKVWMSPTSLRQVCTRTANPFGIHDWQKPCEGLNAECFKQINQPTQQFPAKKTNDNTGPSIPKQFWRHNHNRNPDRCAAVHNHNKTVGIKMNILKNASDIWIDCFLLFFHFVTTLSTIINHFVVHFLHNTCHTFDKQTLFILHVAASKQWIWLSPPHMVFMPCLLHKSNRSHCCNSINCTWCHE